MISLLIGENSFEIERALGQIRAGFSGDVERYGGEKLQLADLPDLLMGVSLFSNERLIIIRNLSDNKSIWPIFGDWIDKISDDIRLVLVESKIDKRTATYKALRSAVEIKEFIAWTDRDTLRAEQWVVGEAKNMSLNLDKKSAQSLVYRVGVDQWALSNALEKLALVDEISTDTINEFIEASPSENVFNLFETALKGDAKKVKKILTDIEQTEDAYKVSALLFSQAFQLSAVALAGDDDNVSKDFAIHPFVVSKMTPIAKKIGKTGAKKVIEILTEADTALKTSVADPWLLIETALYRIVLLKDN